MRPSPRGTGCGVPHSLTHSLTQTDSVSFREETALVKSCEPSLGREAIRRKQTADPVISGDFLLATTATASGQDASRVCPQPTPASGQKHPSEQDPADASLRRASGACAWSWRAAPSQTLTRSRQQRGLSRAAPGGAGQVQKEIRTWCCSGKLQSTAGREEPCLCLAQTPQRGPWRQECGEGTLAICSVVGEWEQESGREAPPSGSRAGGASRSLSLAQDSYGAPPGLPAAPWLSSCKHRRCVEAP